MQPPWMLDELAHAGPEHLAGFDIINADYRHAVYGADTCIKR
jgi:hypothetical protein